MQVSNINSVNNKYNINNKSYFSFTGSKINWTKAGSLLKEELDVMLHIRKDFDIASSIYIKMNDIYQTEFKKFYPDIFPTKNLRGFTFHLPNGGGLQLQKTNNMKGNEELLTFSVIRPDSQSKLHFKVNNNGDYFVSNVGECKDKIPQSKLESLKKIEGQMGLLRRYAQDFIPIRKKIVHAKGEVPTAKDLLARRAGVEAFDGYVQDAQNLLDKFHKVNNLLYKNQSQAAKLKEEFFNSYHHKAKGWSFADDDGNIIILSQSLQKWADTQINITKIDKSGNKKMFLFFADGKIASPIGVGHKRATDMRSYNLEYLTKEEIEANGIKEAMIFLDKKIDEFEHFILEKRGKTPEQIELHKQKVLEKKKERELLASQKPKAKRGRPRKVEAAKPKADKIVQRKANKKTAAAAKPNVSYAKIQSPAVIAKPVNQIPYKTKPVAENPVVKQVKGPSRYEMYLAMDMDNVVKDLSGILQTPIYKRSTHLIHERLQNGLVLEGRFHIIAEDGSKVMVTRVRSNRFYDYSYISIRVTQKDGKVNVMNIDPYKKKIIYSVDGKPQVDNSGKMTYLYPLEFLGKNPWAVNIPKYLEEITKVESSGVSKIVDAEKIKRSKSQAELLAEAEREIARAMRRFEREEQTLF